KRNLIKFVSSSQVDEVDGVDTHGTSAAFMSTCRLHQDPGVAAGSFTALTSAASATLGIIAQQTPAPPASRIKILLQSGRDAMAKTQTGFSIASRGKRPASASLPSLPPTR